MVRRVLFSFANWVLASVSVMPSRRSSPPVTTRASSTAGRPTCFLRSRGLATWITVTAQVQAALGTIICRIEPPPFYDFSITRISNTCLVICIIFQTDVTVLKENDIRVIKFGKIAFFWCEKCYPLQMNKLPIMYCLQKRAGWTCLEMSFM